MRLSEAFVAATITVVACKPGEVDFSNSGNLSDYVAPDTGDSADTAVDTDTGTDSDTDTDSDSDTNSTGEEVKNTTVAYCDAVISALEPDISEFVARDESTSPTLIGDQLFDTFKATLNPRDASASYQTLEACARFTPVDGSAQQVLGAQTIQDLTTHELDVTVDAMTPETGSMTVWIISLNSDGSTRGETKPTPDDPMEHIYTISYQGGAWRVSL